MLEKKIYEMLVEMSKDTENKLVLIETQVNDVRQAVEGSDSND